MWRQTLQNVRESNVSVALHARHISAVAHKNQWLLQIRQPNMGKHAQDLRGPNVSAALPAQHIVAAALNNQWLPQILQPKLQRRLQHAALMTKGSLISTSIVEMNMVVPWLLQIPQLTMRQVCTAAHLMSVAVALNNQRLLQILQLCMEVRSAWSAAPLPSLDVTTAKHASSAHALRAKAISNRGTSSSHR